MDSQAIATKIDLECILDGSMEPKALTLSLLNCITNNFSDEQQIGRGGFAVVYKGQLEYGGEVAVKKLARNIDEDKFIGEVDCMMRAKHKNIVRFLGYCSDAQGEWVECNGKFVMGHVRERLLCFEYVPKGSLDEYIKDESREWRECYKIIKGVCEGLHYLHTKRIVHLDLKPANILLDKYMVPKITDFGISRCFDESQTHVTSKSVGTLGYIAPELFSNSKITFKSDIYSLGVVITEILTGHKGYPQAEKVREYWDHKLVGSKKEQQLQQIQVCTDVAQRCLLYDPEDRPRAQNVIDILKQTEGERGRKDAVTRAFDIVSTLRRTREGMARTFDLLIRAIHKIYAGDAPDLSIEYLNSGVLYLVLVQRKGKELYWIIETTMASEVQSLCRALDDDDDAPADSALFLQELLTMWDRHIWALQIIRDMFTDIDRKSVHVSFKTLIYELGLRLWRYEIARSSKIRQSLVEAVRRQKGGEDELVPGINKMLAELGADVKDMPCLCFQDSRGLHVAGPYKTLVTTTSEEGNREADEGRKEGGNAGSEDVVIGPEQRLSPVDDATKGQNGWPRRREPCRIFCWETLRVCLVVWLSVASWPHPAWPCVDMLKPVK